MTAPLVSASARLVDKASGILASRFSRRGFFVRSAVVGSALVVDPVSYTLKPGNAYAAVCDCYGSACECGSLCCDGYTEFCCTLTGRNTCPAGTLLGGWWKADGTQFCGGPRYYMDCNAPCYGCGCGGNGICGGECSGTGCGCANGDCGNRKSGCTQFRYGQCNNQVACLGPILCRVITCVPPWEIEPTCSTVARTDQNTAYHDRPCLHRVTGSLDTVTDAGVGIRVTGWALDYDTQAPITVHVYVDGVFAGEAVAGGYRADVAAFFPGYGPAHAFDTVVAATGGLHQVCVYGINAGAGFENALLGCQNIKLSRPYGTVDSVTVGTGSATVRGWAVDPDTTGPVNVQILVDGGLVRTVVANQPRPDLGAVLGDKGPNHGFEVNLPLGRGTHQICAEAVKSTGGTTSLGCRPAVIGGPYGAIDQVESSPGALRVIGWAIDPAVTGPVQVQVTLDGAVVATLTADGPRPDVAVDHPAYGAAHGFDARFAAGPGNHALCLRVVNASIGGSPDIDCRTATVPTGNPFGSIELVDAAHGAARIKGWVVDPDVGRSVKVRIEVDGVVVATMPAADPRPDIDATFPGYGQAHGFDVQVPAAAGWRQVCVTAVNLGGGADARLGCRNVQIGGEPFGSLDSVTPLAGSVRLVGWVIDPDTPGPASVRVEVDGVAGPVVTAALDRPDIGAAFPTFGSVHGFDTTIAVPAGSHSICVYGVHSGPGASDPQLGCQTVAV